MLKKIKALRAGLVLSEYINRNSVVIMILLLMVVIGTEMFYSFIKFPKLVSTEARLESFPTNDFYTSVYMRTEKMIKGRSMDIVVFKPNVVSATGQLLPVLFSPFLIFLKPDRYVSYMYFIGLTGVAFTIFFLLLMKKVDKQILYGGLLFLIAFFLSEPGFLGIYMGNTDIFLAPLLGIVVLIVLRNKETSFWKAIGLGVLAGSLLNIKITLFPFILVAGLFSKRILAVFSTLFLTFFTLIYIPNLFGAPSSLVLYVNKVLVWNNLDLFGFHIWANHSVYAIASLFSGCIKTNTCDKQIINSLIAWSLFLFTLLTPFLLFLSKKQMLFNKSTFYSLIKIDKNKELALVLFVLSDLFINLFFRIVYDYRLFFSLVVTLIVFKESVRIKKALTYCYLAMFFLLFGGIWVIQFNPHELWTIDARFLKFFIISHYFFLVLSSLVLLKESQVKARLLQ